MNASLQAPRYQAVILTAGGQRCVVTGAVTGLSLGWSENEIAQKATLSVWNQKHQGVLFTSLFKPRDRVFLYADTGEGDKEVFRGYIWEKQYQSALEKEITYVCYDNLIYLQESEDSLYFPAGRSTESIFAAVCKKWGVPLQYRYQSITHSKLPLKGALADMLLSDLLEPVRKQTGQRYVLRSIQDTLCVDPAGSNGTVYKLAARANVLYTRTSVSMDGMATQAVITGKADSDGRAPVEATLSKNTAAYGTLQKVLASSDADSLADARKEAEELLKEKAQPSHSASIKAADIPWVRKGDRVDVAAGDLGGAYLVLGVTHDAMQKTMELDIERFNG